MRLNWLQSSDCQVKEVERIQASFLKGRQLGKTPSKCAPSITEALQMGSKILSEALHMRFLDNSFLSAEKANRILDDSLYHAYEWSFNDCNRTYF